MKQLSINDDFNAIIKEGVWVVDFSATWCGPCRMLEPNLVELSKEYNVLQVDVDKFPDLAGVFGVLAVPSVFVFRDGVLVKQSSGYQTVDELKEMINQKR